MRIDLYIHDIDLYIHDADRPGDSAPPWAVEMRSMLGRILENQRTEKTIMSDMDDRLAKATADAAATRTVVDSAIVALNGIGAAVKQAVDDALAAGATPAQLQSLTDLDTAITSQGTDLAAAIPVNTPAATP